MAHRGAASQRGNDGYRMTIVGATLQGVEGLEYLCCTKVSIM